MSAAFMGSDISMARDFADTPIAAKRPVPRRRVRRIICISRLVMCAQAHSMRSQMAGLRSNEIHRALKLPPMFWPCLPDPHCDAVSPATEALYAELEQDASGVMRWPLALNRHTADNGFMKIASFAPHHGPSRV
jgi:hypothetical protein